MSNGETVDDPLWNLLREQAATDRVPDLVREAAVASLSWRDPDSALAALIADSDVDDEQLTLVRGGGPARLLTFATGELTIEIEVTGTGRAVGLVGQLVPGVTGTVAVDHADGVIEVPADELGRFQVSGVSTGPVRLRCRPDRPAAAPTRTDWFLV